MPRYCHEWTTLITLPVIPPDKRLIVAFGVGLSRLDVYDRCRCCGRLSFITKSRWRRRKLVSSDTTGILRRAAELQEWIAKELLPRPATA